MDITPPQPSTKAPAANFTGDVWSNPIAQGKSPSRLRISTVHFAPGARTAWHSHALGQSLHVVEGHALVQARGGDIVEVGPGQTVHAPAGEWHWHGATPDHFMTHLALSETPEDGTPAAEWGPHVTDEEYEAR